MFEEFSKPPSTPLGALLFLRGLARSVDHRSQQPSVFFGCWGEERRNSSRRWLGESGFCTVRPGSRFTLVTEAPGAAAGWDPSRSKAPGALAMGSPWSGNRELRGPCLTVRSLGAFGAPQSAVGSSLIFWFFFNSVLGDPKMAQDLAQW